LCSYQECTALDLRRRQKLSLLLSIGIIAIFWFSLLRLRAFSLAKLPRVGVQVFGIGTILSKILILAWNIDFELDSVLALRQYLPALLQVSRNRKEINRE
jgi:hypothetical protein